MEDPRLKEFNNIVLNVMLEPLKYKWEIQGFCMLRTYISKNTRLQN